MHDELRRLDEDLADGRLDADSYRRLRDELLATRPSEPPPPSPPRADRDAPRPDEVAPDEVAPDAVAPGAVAPVAVAPVAPAPGAVAPGELGSDGVLVGDPAPAGAAVAAPDVCDPFPPPFRWHGSGGSEGGSGPGGDRSGAVADLTQVVASRPVAATADAPERTQVVRGAVDGATPPGAADATQVVGRSRVRDPGPRHDPPRAGPLAPPAPPERTQFVPGAALTRAGDLRSVPARRTTPPWVDERSSAPVDARRPGREVFARGRGPSPAAVLGTAALVLVVLVVLALSFLLR